MVQSDALVLIQIWHSGSKYQRIRALVRANYKQLKAALALRVKKLGSLFLMSKLGEFPLFNGFLDLANFCNLDIFWHFDLPNFLIIFTLLTLLSRSPSPISTKINLSSGAAVFSIEVSRAAILLNPWINCQ